MLHLQMRHRGRPVLMAVALLLALPAPVLADARTPSAAAPPAAPAAPMPGADAVTPVEEFSRQIEQLKSTFGELNRKIEERAKIIDSQTDAQASQKDIAELRGMVAALLGAVADNGDVARLGAKALSHARDKLQQLKNEKRYTEEQREFLSREWNKLARETETATRELEGARARFSNLLKTLQTKDDYVSELLELRQGAEALKIIRSLTKEIHDASDMLNNFITTIAPPRAGS